MLVCRAKTGWTHIHTHLGNENYSERKCLDSSVRLFRSGLLFSGLALTQGIHALQHLDIRIYMVVKIQ